MNAAAVRRLEAADDAPSPCISVCEMDPRSGYCRGCLRTLDEIAAWSVLDVDTKRAVLAMLPSRRAGQPDSPR
jgi:predicted Fe-S protein YdhL (DUF1289 family)